MKRSCLGLCPLCAAPFAWAARSSAGGGQKSESKVKPTATASKAGDDGKQTVTITLEIDKGWHIYANPVGAEGFEDNKIDVAIKAKEKVVASVKYPEGKVKNDVIGKKKVQLRIYENKVIIQATVTPHFPGRHEPAGDQHRCQRLRRQQLPGQGGQVKLH